MTNKKKEKVVMVSMWCGAGVNFILHHLTGITPGGMIGALLGGGIFAGIAAFVVYVLIPKENKQTTTD